MDIKYSNCQKMIKNKVTLLWEALYFSEREILNIFQEYRSCFPLQCKQQQQDLKTSGGTHFICVWCFLWALGKSVLPVGCHGDQFTAWLTAVQDLDSSWLLWIDLLAETGIWACQTGRWPYNEQICAKLLTFALNVVYSVWFFIHILILKGVFLKLKLWRISHKLFQRA